MKFSRFSHDMVAELLVFLAENEQFASIKRIKDISRSDVQTLLHEMAEQVKKLSENQAVVNRSEIRGNDLTDTTQEVISNLSPHEETILLRSFKIAQ